MVDYALTAGRVGRGGAQLRVSGVAEGAIPFGSPVEDGTAAEQVLVYAGGTLLGFAIRDPYRAHAQAGLLNEPTEIDDGQVVGILQQGAIAVSIAADVSKRNKVAIVQTAGDSGFNVGDIVDDTASSGSGDIQVIENSWFEEGGTSGDVVEARIDLPSATTIV